MFNQNNDDDKVPDFFEDPAEVAAEEAVKIAQQLQKKHNELLKKAISWQLYWQSAAMSPESPEEQGLSAEDLNVAMLFRFELLLMEIVKELKRIK